MRILTIMSFGVFATALSAQAPDDSAKTPSIQDNSFIVEEAYNQEAGVVQHIFAFGIERATHNSELGITQEWPAGGITHQLSYTIPLLHSGTPVKRSSLGDVLLNYRYQAIGDGSTIVAISPRFSVSLPTGDWKKGDGTGAAGYEAFLPASLVLSDLVVGHLNAGLRYTPSARNSVGDRAGTKKLTLGGSAILRAAPLFNLLLETVWSREDEVVGRRRVAATKSWTILPGARAAFNFSSGLQIVPGIGFPFGVGPSKGARAVFLYLSFEHPFNAEGRAK